MNPTERIEMQRTLWNVYCGILHGLRGWAAGGTLSVTYRCDCPEFQTLLARYPVEKVDGKGSGFARALRLCRWLYPRLKHNGVYKNCVPCNSLALLDFCFEKEDGINCVNKAKILAECCLALGIPARRVYLYPLSPYDLDNHVVTEIYDSSLKNWIMLDPTEGTYFTGVEGKPLSVLEVRDAMANNLHVTAVRPRQSIRDLDALFEKNLSNGINCYYAKNMAYFMVDCVNTFGTEGACALLAPAGLDVRARVLQHIRFVLRWAKREATHLVDGYEAWYKSVETQEDMPRISETAWAAMPNFGG